MSDGITPGRARILAAVTAEYETVDVIVERAQRSYSTVATALWILHRRGLLERTERRTGKGRQWRIYYRRLSHPVKGADTPPPLTKEK